MAGGRQPTCTIVTLASSSLLFFVAFAYIAVLERSSSHLPDLLVEIKLGGKMKINTANGPMLLSVGKHMQCKQCHSTGFTQKGFSQLASCPCEVPVGGMKDGVYYSGVITVTRVDKDEPEVEEVQPERNAEPKDLNGCNTKPLHLRVTAKGTFLEGLPVYAGDARTEAMLRQLLQFFGPDQEKGWFLMEPSRANKSGTLCIRTT
uniref:Uncharacterized protein n=1 Tax=Hanusia phi TaxID=3032 RepID=A0A7S0EJD5_9CRYP|mmetsp:Transcript_2584/g.6178  ORF Transcript_2584/g.6178 Transcript_2584/m.6178 type:complete len:204 (+) Transcript_2584:40-651(+)